MKTRIKTKMGDQEQEGATEDIGIDIARPLT